ncbi:unnamed protein product [Microthlaspi erraticum]|uniref:Uncharacterized protein n=1 Tax=Microthlaspi erraticum TaxID=1685480 RepID=A0A6D2HF83_9BRAS|nr:unnamed protein product [Microthlaspi erraticum]
MLKRIDLATYVNKVHLSSRSKVHKHAWAGVMEGWVTFRKVISETVLSGLKARTELDMMKREWDRMGRDGTRWDITGWDRTRRIGKKWDRTIQKGTGQNQTERDRTVQDGARYDETG